MNWLEPRIGTNPIRHVQKVQTSGGEQTKRRAFTADELQRLIGVSGPAALFTGLQHGQGSDGVSLSKPNGLTCTWTEPSRSLLCARLCRRIIPTRCSRYPPTLPQRCSD